MFSVPSRLVLLNKFFVIFVYFVVNSFRRAMSTVEQYLKPEVIRQISRLDLRRSSS